MINNKLFISWVEQFSQEFLSIISIKLENYDMDISSDNIICIIQEIELDNLEYIFLKEYRYEFIKWIKANI